MARVYIYICIHVLYQSMILDWVCSPTFSKYFRGKKKHAKQKKKNNEPFGWLGGFFLECPPPKKIANFGCHWRRTAQRCYRIAPGRKVVGCLGHVDSAWRCPGWKMFGGFCWNPRYLLMKMEPTIFKNMILLGDTKRVFFVLDLEYPPGN